jgi:hypothetical protein
VSVAVETARLNLYAASKQSDKAHISSRDLPFELHPLDQVTPAVVIEESKVCNSLTAPRPSQARRDPVMAVCCLVCRGSRFLFGYEELEKNSPRAGTAHEVSA